LRLEALVAHDRDLLKTLVNDGLVEILQAKMTEFLAAAPAECSTGRLSYRAGYHERGLVTGLGNIELPVPREHSGEFSTALFQRFERSKKALVSALVKMYVHGVSTRKVKGDHGAAARARLRSVDHKRPPQNSRRGLTKFAHGRLTEA
jgi:putative transposase